MNILDNPLLVFALCCAVAWFIGWPIIKGAFPDSFPLEDHGTPAFDEYGWTGDAQRRERWERGQKGGYSPYFPGREGGR